MSDICSESLAANRKGRRKQPGCWVEKNVLGYFIWGERVFEEAANEGKTLKTVWNPESLHGLWCSSIHDPQHVLSSEQLWEKIKMSLYRELASWVAGTTHKWPRRKQGRASHLPLSSGETEV
jgi:hypothetical protein